MVALPAVVAMIAGCFALLLLRQFARNPKPHLFVWDFSLALGCLAAIAFVLFTTHGHNTTLFRIYYGSGGLLMAAYLGLGSVYLLLPRRVAHLIAVAVIAISLSGLILLAQAHIMAKFLHGNNVEAGTRAISGSVVLVVIMLNTFGAVAVVGGAAFSAFRLLKRHGPEFLVAANILIAGGTLLASLAGTLARVTGSGSAFWALLAVGFFVLFAGFLLTTPGRWSSWFNKRSQRAPRTEGHPAGSNRS